MCFNNFCWLLTCHKENTPLNVCIRGSKGQNQGLSKIDIAGHVQYSVSGLGRLTRRLQLQWDDKVFCCLSLRSSRSYRGNSTLKI